MLRTTANLWVIAVSVLLLPVALQAQTGVLLDEDFSTDVILSGSWTASNASVSVDAVNSWLRIGNNGAVDDFAEKVGPFQLPVAIEWRVRTYTGAGSYFSIPKLELWFESSGTGSYHFTYVQDDQSGNPDDDGWLFGGWSNNHTLGTTGWNQWRTIKAVVKSDGGEVYAKQDGDIDYTLVATKTWAIPDVIERLHFSQVSDDVSDLDYIRVSSLGQESEDIFCDNFDSYSSSDGWSGNWHGSGNTSGITIDNSVYSTGSGSLRMYGQQGACWGAVATQPINTSLPLKITLDVRNGSDNVFGCHPYRASIGLRTGGPSWQNCPCPQFIYFLSNGNLVVPEPSGQKIFSGFALNQWHQVELQLTDPGDGQLHVSIDVNGQNLGEFLWPLEAWMTEQAYLDLSSQEGTVWFDEVCVGRVINENCIPFTVQGNQMWQNTGVHVRSGDEIRITASGNIRVSTPGAGLTYNPDGCVQEQLPACNKTPNGPLALCSNSTFADCLVGKIGINGDCFYVGSDFQGVATSDGDLYLAFNDATDAFHDNDGTFETCISFSNNHTDDIFCTELNAGFDCGLAILSVLPCIGAVPGALDIKRSFCNAAEYDEGSFMNGLWKVLAMFNLYRISVDLGTGCLGDFGASELTGLFAAGVSCAIARAEENAALCADGLTLECILAVVGIDWWNHSDLGIFGILASPVELSLEDENGNQLGNSPVHGVTFGSVGAEFLIARGPSHKKYILISQTQEIVTLVLTGDTTAVYPDSTFDLFILSHAGATDGVAFENIPIGHQRQLRYNMVPGGTMSDVLIGDINVDGVVDTIRLYSSLSGQVAAGETPLIGVNVDLFDSTGTLISSMITDEAGFYSFDSLKNGYYTISLMAPLGFQVHESVKGSSLYGLPSTIDFELFTPEAPLAVRGRGYWLHQVNALLTGKGNPQETYESMCYYMEIIRTHFNEHGLNSVNVFQVALTDDCNQRLEALRETISPKANATMNEKARAHLTCLLLNMVSGKIAQWQSISEDSLTVSQAITYCNVIITDSDDANDELAKAIAEMINEGETVPAGWIDPLTPDIAYKQGSESSPPSEYVLSQNYPNPFNPSTTISFALPNRSEVLLEIFNVMGQKVATLQAGDMQAGEHQIKWDGTTSSGAKAASGMYFYRLKAGDNVQTRKMVLLK